MLVQPGSQPAKALTSPKLFLKLMAGGRNGFCVDITIADCAGLEPADPLPLSLPGSKVGNGWPFGHAQDRTTPGLLLSTAGGGRTGPERLPTVSAAATAVMAPLRGNDCRLLTWHSAHTHERSRKGGTLAARYICRHRIHKQNTGHATGLAGAPVPMDGVSAPPAPRSLPAWFLGRARCWPGGTALNVTGPCRAQSSRRTRHREWREAHRPCGEAPGLCAAVPEPAGHWNTRAACWCCRRSSFLAIRSWLFPGLAQAIV